MRNRVNTFETRDIGLFVLMVIAGWLMMYQYMF